MHYEQSVIYHLYNRGNNKQPIFFSPANYKYFLDNVRELLMPVCDILGWCLMPNHFHFVIMPGDAGCRQEASFGSKAGMQLLAKNIGMLQSRYAQAINKQQGTTGSLFQQKARAKPVDESFAALIGSRHQADYLLTVVSYIHLNPVRAGLVSEEAHWPWSSFRDYAGLRNGTLCNKALLIELTMGKGFIL